MLREGVGVAEHVLDALVTHRLRLLPPAAATRAAAAGPTATACAAGAAGTPTMSSISGYSSRAGSRCPVAPSFTDSIRRPATAGALRVTAPEVSASSSARLPGGGGALGVVDAVTDGVMDGEVDGVGDGDTVRDAVGLAVGETVVLTDGDGLQCTDGHSGRA